MHSLRDSLPGRSALVKNTPEKIGTGNKQALAAAPVCMIHYYHSRCSLIDHC
jgi:hypothetical protein